MSTTRKPDVVIENHGTITLFRCNNERVIKWLLRNTDGNWFGAYALAVEPRYAANLAAGLNDNGFKYAVAA